MRTQCAAFEKICYHTSSKRLKHPILLLRTDASSTIWKCPILQQQLSVNHIPTEILLTKWARGWSSEQTLLRLQICHVHKDTVIAAILGTISLQQLLILTHSTCLTRDSLVRALHLTPLAWSIYHTEVEQNAVSFWGRIKYLRPSIFLHDCVPINLSLPWVFNSPKQRCRGAFERALNKCHGRGLRLSPHNLISAIAFLRLMV